MFLLDPQLADLLDCENVNIIIVKARLPQKGQRPLHIFAVNWFPRLIKVSKLVTKVFSHSLLKFSRRSCFKTDLEITVLGLTLTNPQFKQIVQ